MIARFDVLAPPSVSAASAMGIAQGYFLVFGVLAIAGGVMGFVKAKSKASLIAGGVSGLLLMLAGALILLGRSPGPTVGLAIGLVVSLLLAGRFGAVFAKSRKMMPAGLMLGLGVLGALLSALALAA